MSDYLQFNRERAQKLLDRLTDVDGDQNDEDELWLYLKLACTEYDALTEQLAHVTAERDAWKEMYESSEQAGADVVIERDAWESVARERDKYTRTLEAERDQARAERDAQQALAENLAELVYADTQEVAERIAAWLDRKANKARQLGYSAEQQAAGEFADDIRNGAWKSDALANLGDREKPE